MELELPKTKIKSDRKNPNSLILFAQPKTGKTTILSGLDNCLIIDLEGGTDFVNAMKIDILAGAKERDTLPISFLKQVLNKIEEENKKQKKYTYKYIAVDTVSALEEIVLPLANKMYKDTPMGKNWVGKDVRTLPNGAGYRFTRLAFFTVIEEIQKLCDTIILVGHVKDKLIEKKGKEMNERSLSLTGQTGPILCSKVDAIAYLYRDENKTFLNFVPSENLVIGSRVGHLKGQNILVAESDQDNNVKIDWSKVFID